MLLPVLFDGQWVGLVYYALLGVVVGFMTPAGNALWREFYGTPHLGAILAMVHALIVLSSAVAPVAYGLMLDAQWGWGLVLILNFSYMVIAYVPFLGLSDTCALLLVVFPFPDACRLLKLDLFDLSNILIVVL